MLLTFHLPSHDRFGFRVSQGFVWPFFVQICFSYFFIIQCTNADHLAVVALLYCHKVSASRWPLVVHRMRRKKTESILFNVFTLAFPATLLWTNSILPNISPSKLIDTIAVIQIFVFELMTFGLKMYSLNILECQKLLGSVLPGPYYPPAEGNCGGQSQTDLIKAGTSSD